MQSWFDIRNIQTKAYYKLLQVSKEVYHRTLLASGHPKTIVFIVGCQRSGTTLMNEIFERDTQTKVYAECSRLSSNDAPKRLRLNPLDSVKKVLERDKAPIIILKPLVESQNILTLLDYFEGSKALWIYRNYKDVALSHIRKWGNKNSINDLRAIIEERPHNWRYENVTREIKETVVQYFSEDMDPYDSVALYWFVRNSFVFKLGLHNLPRIKIRRYESLVKDPITTMQEIYTFLDRDFPGSNIIKEVHSSSVQKAKNIKLSPEIELLCQELLEQLDQTQDTVSHQLQRA